MKKMFAGILVILTTIGIWYSCTNSEEQNPLIEKSGEVSFIMNMNELINESKVPQFNKPCLDLATLQALSANKQLTANITIKDGATTLPTIVIPVNLIGGVQLITDPYVFNMDAPHTYSIDQITITSTNTDYPGVLYSSVNCDSPNMAWITPGCCTPKSFTPELYKKTEVSTCVFCAFNETPSKFGYIKWNIDFTRKFCIPFSVNICDATNKDELGTGTLKIEKGTMSGSVFTATKDMGTTTVPADASTLASLCFTDNLGIDNNLEYFRYTLVINSRTFIGIVNVTELLKYKLSNAWDSTNNYLHLWFCIGKSHWFFNETENPACQPYMVFNVSTTWNTNTDLFKYSTDEGISWINGLPGFTNGTPAYAQMSTGIILQTHYPYKYGTLVATPSLLTTIDIQTIAGQSGVSMQAYLIDNTSNASFGPVSLTPTTTNNITTYSVNYGAFQGTVINNCYFVKIVITGTPKITQVNIYTPTSISM
ncbi:MAG: hypothetical protein RR346_06735 [Bacteroidales bacterium]